MEPGSDEAYRTQLEPELVYTFNNPWHGKGAKRSIEGSQICTQAKQLAPALIRGSDFVAVRQCFQYQTAAPGKKTGSRWSHLLVFPAGQRYFVSMDRIDSVNSSDAMFLRIDMPGHIRHKQGDTFEEIQEFGGRPGPAGGSFSAAFIVGYFDSIEEMHAVYDRYRGATALAVGPDGWRLEPAGSD
jgi:hypothetical protein